MDEQIPWLIGASVVPCWLGACYFAAWLSGWHELAEAYTDRGEFLGERFRFRTGTFGVVCKYENSLTFSVDHDGLRIQVIFFLRPGHARLFVPWGHITAEHEKSFFGSGTALTFKHGPSVRLRIPDDLAESLLEHARGKYNVNVS